jgi:hypothetical protein
MKILTKLRARFGRTASPEPDSPEPEFLRFKAVAGALPQLPDISPNKKMLADLLVKDPKLVRWDEIQAGQIALAEVMPLEMLKARFGNLSDEYEAVTGGKPFVHGAFPNPPNDNNIVGWRAGVVNLIEELAKFRRAKLFFERRRSIVAIFIGFIVTSLLLFGFWHSLSVSQSDPPPLWHSLVFAGIVGAGFSVLTRLYALGWSKLTSQIEDVEASAMGLWTNCFLSITKGVIAAYVIYLLFSSGLLKGDLFPAFNPPTTKTPPENSFVQLFTQEPKTTADMAKLFIWAFIAGFAERLVPDKLSLLAGEASNTKKKK